MNTPNKLTVLRIILIPVYIVFLMADICPFDNYIAAVVFIIASLTDMLDGKIARKNNLVTDFGKFADPLADKLLTCSAFICFVQLGMMPGWICIVIVARELAVSGFRLVLAGKGTVLAAAMSGKIKTTLQMVYIIVATLNGAVAFNWMGLPESALAVYNLIVTILMYIVLILTVVSMIEMFYKNRGGFDANM